MYEALRKKIAKGHRQFFEVDLPGLKALAGELGFVIEKDYSGPTLHKRGDSTGTWRITFNSEEPAKTSAA
ncbi:MAG TPA: hypothetical protein VEP30_09990 [Chthoniobacterales bacterium]|nr:hypothetical protein [Chthoniobacterales bacterium]